MYATVDNTDISQATYRGFEGFYWSAAFGIDNLNNRQYFLFHPFPQRTVFAELKCDY